MISKKDIFIRIIDHEPDIKYRVEHTKDKGIVAYKKPKKNWKDKTIMQGGITVNGYLRKFYMSLNMWSAADYVRQWDEGLRRLNEHDSSCLVLDINNDEGNFSLEWWVMYRVNGKIHMQYRLCFYSAYKEIIGDRPFTPETCYDFIPPRETYEEDGTKIAEWIVGD